MKRILPAALAAVMILALVGCTNPNPTRTRSYYHPYEVHNYNPNMSVQSAFPG